MENKNNKNYIVFNIDAELENSIQRPNITIRYTSFGPRKICFFYFTSTLTADEVFGDMMSAELPSNCFLFPVSDFPIEFNPEKLRLFTITPTIVYIHDVAFYSYQYFPPDQELVDPYDFHVRDIILENHKKFTRKIPLFVLYTNIPISEYNPDVVHAVRQHAKEWKLGKINYHLHFTGATFYLCRNEEIEIIKQCVEEVNRDFIWPQNPTISFGKLDTFGHPSHPRVIWLSMVGEMNDLFVEWNSILIKKAQDHGIAFVFNNHQLHMTLSMHNCPNATKMIGTPLRIPPAQIKEIILLRGEGHPAKYDIMAHYPIGRSEKEDRLEEEDTFEEEDTLEINEVPINQECYILSVADPNLALDVSEASMDLAAPLILSTFHGKDNQKFRFLEDGHIQSVSSGLMIDCARGRGGQRIIQYKWIDSPKQKWDINPNGTINCKCGFCLDIQRFKYKKGTNIIAWHPKNTLNQKWRVIPVSK